MYPKDNAKMNNFFSIFVFAISLLHYLFYTIMALMIFCTVLTFATCYSWSLPGDKQITLDEYTTFWDTVVPNMGTVAAGIFRNLDSDRSGVVEKDEVNGVYGALDVDCEHAH